MKCNGTYIYYIIWIKKKKKNTLGWLEMPGIEPGTSHMRSARSTTELHPPAEKALSVIGIHSG